MAAIRLKIESGFVGPLSIGTVAVIQILREQLQLSLPDAKQYVDRCVFDAETVIVHAPSEAAARAAVSALGALESPPKIHATSVR